ncbi:5-histidylcysteine sulfoxide synthase [Glaciimonas sp. CA11.2]|uniref:5-histidylcysteine sulfoxide synthase n=1 Tax=Glaciimonas sp. CA11.2 TaxID=3048601 RepID=UPI002AB43770|nr:5-histidylcysteine sulfoxide synthase [Glaciimonas sp. CA11.2]MDY7548302.1 5-histidylcysteine sulfoxide synthase [Glaciimonas sp. CA11.2]
MTLPQPTRTVLLNHSNSEQKRAEILAYFTQTFDLYESLFNCLSDERAWYNKAINLRHPLIFYFGHTAAFFINKLLAAHLINERIDPKIEAMVAIGVDEMSWDDLNEQHYDWPSIMQMRAYRIKVRAKVIQLITHIKIASPIDRDSAVWVLLMGIEHERIHLETSSVLIRQLSLAYVSTDFSWPICPHASHILGQAPINSLIDIPAQSISIGKLSSDATYGWDNEYGQRNIAVADFQVSQFLVSNEEFLAFVLNGAYQEKSYWSDEGWNWCRYSGVSMPTFWVGDIKQTTRLKLRLMLEEVPMPWNWPVEVNQYEAAAFCAWKAAFTGLPIQLPSEMEWKVLRERIACDQPDWVSAPGNVNLEHWASPCPVDQFPQDEFYDVIGNLWQWTSTATDGLQGFKIYPLYDDFSVPTFDGKHILIKGGSWISTGNLGLRSARYAFRRHFFQHAGFRYVTSHYQEKLPMNPYETDSAVAQYLDFHYGPEYFGVANFSKKLADISAMLCEKKHRALDIGCAVGRSALELARHFSHVDGVDYSARFIDVAIALIKHDRVRYEVPIEGELFEYREVCLSELELNAEQAIKVNFSQGDACNLSKKYRDYDLVLAANLIDRLVEPAVFLEDIGTRIRPGGLLLLTSPYTWLEEHTPKSNWLGGFRENGEAVTTYQALKRILATMFDEVQAPQDIDFVIRETSRKYQHTQAQLTIWRRKMMPK